MKKKVYALPGIMCNEQLWSRLVVFIKDDFELVHLDIPLKENLDVMVEALLEEMKEDKINLLGFSLGGYLASYLACKYPQRIERLFLLSSTPCDLPQDEIIKREKVIQMSRQFGFKGLARQKIISLLDKKNHNNEPLIALIATMYQKLGQEVFISQFSSTLNRPDLLQELLKQKFPLTFMYANNDRLVNLSWIKTFQENATKASFIELEGTSHMLPLEESKKICNALKCWLTIS